PAAKTLALHDALPIFSRWVRDGSGALEHFVVDRYFERTSWADLIAPAFRTPVLRRHRPLEDYIAAPLESGLLLREFREPSVTEEARKSTRLNSSHLVL